MAVDCFVLAQSHGHQGGISYCSPTRYTFDNSRLKKDIEIYNMVEKSPSVDGGV